MERPNDITGSHGCEHFPDAATKPRTESADEAAAA